MWIGVGIGIKISNLDLGWGNEDTGWGLGID